MYLLVFLALNAASFVAAGAIAARGFRERTAECALVWAVSWFALSVIPVHALGWTDLLTRPNLALASLGSSLLVIALAFPVHRWRDGVRDVVGAGREILAGARRVCADSLRERSFAALGLVAVVAITAWTGLLSYLAPNVSWDGLLYHDPMVGYAIQNEGFAITGNYVEDPFQGPIDGFPRMAENFGLWLVIWIGREVIELPAALISPIVLFAFYTMAQRFTVSRTIAAGYACALFLIPGFVLQLRSTYVDSMLLAIFGAALHFATRPEIRSRDVMMASLALGLVGGMKVVGLILVPLLALFVIARFATACVRKRAFRHLPMLIAGAILCASLAAPTYARNWIAFDNPLFPVRMRIEALGIEFPGLVDTADQNRDTGQLLHDLFAPPIPGRQYHDTRDNGYGDGPPFVILPLAILGTFVALWLALVPGKLRPYAEPGAGAVARNLLLTTIPVAATIIISPERGWARYNLHVVLALWLIAAWLTTRRQLRALAQGVIAVLTITGLMSIWWSDPGWDVPFDRALVLLHSTREGRTAIATQGPGTLPPEVALARERQVRAGDLVVFSQHPFPGNLWNEDMSNRVLYVNAREHRGSWLAHVETMGARWAVVHGGLVGELSRSPRWHEVGRVNEQGGGTVFVFRRPGDRF